ncbi:MAG: tetratricopeptide repeat protein [Bryobacterales bacterium]|nr:tetratricopeptide repeat protein [Bryobacteraceae bacterium]MDW8129442.1 tetratricopeptide repeat protein [Bryobacterales bacterium]
MRTCGLWLVLAAGLAWAQAPDPAYPWLEKAYTALRAADYDRAIESFRRAIELAPERAALRKDLAYAYLKIGENEAALEEFAQAMRLDPSDHHLALEYAFLCYETGRRAEARRVFDRVRQTGDPASRAAAEQAFQNIDRALAEAIARWLHALDKNPGDWGTHLELARLAEERNELELAATHYEKAWRLRPERRGVLADLGRVWLELGHSERGMAALLAASRGAEPYAADRARGLLPSRYPYVAEFESALKLDPTNVPLRRELAYLLLELGRTAEAEQHFRAIVGTDSSDLLAAAQLALLLLARGERQDAQPLIERVLAGEDAELAARMRRATGLPPVLPGEPPVPQAPQASPLDARAMGERSYQAGFLKDALKYLQLAHEQDPADFAVMLKLGWTYNMLGQDDRALRWFQMASYSPDPAIASEATRASRSLQASLARLRSSFWWLPFYSSRWRDVFSYSQLRTEFRFRRLPLRPYGSLRFIGDSRSRPGGAIPQYFSETALIAAIGISTPGFRGSVLWAEAGVAISYLERPPGGRRLGDWRGGLAFSRAFGRPLGAESGGRFFETGADAVYLSRFDHDVLFYWRNRAGYTAARSQSLGGLATQCYWNLNVAADARRQYWASFVESGPGFRFRWEAMPAGMYFSLDLLRGVHTLNRYNPRRPNYWDWRAGFWYAVSR